MYRGIRGTFIYACDKDLQEYFKNHIPIFKAENNLKILPFDQVNPFFNAIPILYIYAAAGSFSDLQTPTECENFKWIEIPNKISNAKDYFVCQVIGESMNKKIENGSWCLFKKNPGGTIEGKIVLVEHFNIQDSDFGAGYTLKSYHSEKIKTDEGWEHKSITLKPLSYDSAYESIELEDNEIEELKVIGEFITVLDL